MVDLRAVALTATLAVVLSLPPVDATWWWNDGEWSDSWLKDWTPVTDTYTKVWGQVTDEHGYGMSGCNVKLNCYYTKKSGLWGTGTDYSNGYDVTTDNDGWYKHDQVQTYFGGDCTFNYCDTNVVSCPNPCVDTTSYTTDTHGNKCYWLDGGAYAWALKPSYQCWGPKYKINYKPQCSPPPPPSPPPPSPPPPPVPIVAPKPPPPRPPPPPPIYKSPPPPSPPPPPVPIVAPSPPPPPSPRPPTPKYPPPPSPPPPKPKSPPPPSPPPPKPKSPPPPSPPPPKPKSPPPPSPPPPKPKSPPPPSPPPPKPKSPPPPSPPPPKPKYPPPSPPPPPKPKSPPPPSPPPPKPKYPPPAPPPPPPIYKKPPPPSPPPPVYKRPPPPSPPPPPVPIVAPSPPHPPTPPGQCPPYSIVPYTDCPYLKFTAHPISCTAPTPAAPQTYKCVLQVDLAGKGTISGVGSAQLKFTYPQGYGKVVSVDQCSYSRKDGSCTTCRKLLHTCTPCFVNNGYTTASVVTIRDIAPTVASSPAVFIKITLETQQFKFSGTYDTPCGPVHFPTNIVT